MSSYCGLCKESVLDWERHVRSEIHQKSLNDMEKVIELVCEENMEFVVPQILEQENLGRLN